MPSNKAADWENSKTDYKELTGAKKPKEKVLGFFKTSHTSLSGGIKDCDKAVDSGDAKKIKENTAKLKKSVDTYVATLDGLINKEKDANAGEKTDLAKAMKALKLRLTSYVAYFESEASIAEKLATTTNQMEVAEHMAQSNFKQVIAGVAADLARIKAGPSPELWDKLIGAGDKGAARRLTTALNNLQLANKTDNSYKAHITALTPYASGNLATMPAKATPPEVLQRLVAFAQLVKAVQAAYA